MSNDKDKQTTNNQYAFILNYQPQIEHQTNNFGDDAKKDTTSKKDRGAKKTNARRSKERTIMTFISKPILLDERLKILYLILSNDGWITSNIVDFKALFSGEMDEDCKIVWNGKYGKGTLVGLFKRLKDEGFIDVPKGFTLPAILEGHFQDSNGDWLSGLDKGNAANSEAQVLIDQCIELMKKPIENDVFADDDEPDIRTEYDKDRMHYV